VTAPALYMSFLLLRSSSCVAQADSGFHSVVVDGREAGGLVVLNADASHSSLDDGTDSSW
jgi:hypothetical protein